MNSQEYEQRFGDPANAVRFFFENNATFKATFHAFPHLSASHIDRAIMTEVRRRGEAEKQKPMEAGKFIIRHTEVPGYNDEEITQLMNEKL